MGIVFVYFAERGLGRDEKLNFNSIFKQSYVDENFHDKVLQNFYNLQYKIRKNNRRLLLFKENFSYLCV